MTYKAPLADIRMALATAAGLPSLIERGLLEGVDQDVVDSVLEEAGKFAEERLVPLDAAGDRQGLRLEAGRVRVPDGWNETYKAWTEGGWGALPGPSEHGGQGLPQLLSMAVCEIWNSANLSFSLASLLTQGAIDALHTAASDQLKRLYLPRMISGEWTGTMNLTEPQVGTDLGNLRTRAEPRPDGTFRLFGTKIFITYGEHEMTPNIVHLVLARLPGAPPGTRGISLFLVPKYLLGPDGEPGERNDLVCSRLESKLGIHASPTCEMTFGQKGGAVGWLVGEANRGLNTMFIMMNRARLGVGVQGVAVAERASQRALAYANVRRQGRTATTPAGQMALIAEHPDVRRNLLTMRALTAAARAICYATAAAIDVGERSPDATERERAAGRVALLTPVAKAWSTDIGVRVASIGIQVHGGMGFIEDTGAAQHYRDARILPIYEGTNGVQAIDLVTRKLPLGGGAVVVAYLGELGRAAAALKAASDARLQMLGGRLERAVGELAGATRWLGERLKSGDVDPVLAVATPYLELFGTVAGGVYLAEAAQAAAGGPAATHWLSLAEFYAGNILPTAGGLAATVTDGGGGVLGADAGLFSA